MAYPVKKEGDICEKCGGKYVKNPKTGKVFCENKCWLMGGDTTPKSKEVDWDKINSEKKENINWSVAWKIASQLATIRLVSMQDDAEMMRWVEKQAEIIYTKLQTPPPF